MTLRDTFRSYVERRLSPPAKPDTYVDGGGSVPKSFFKQTERDWERLHNFRATYDNGGPVARLIDSRSVAAFGTGAQLTSSDPNVEQWLREQFDDCLDNLLIDIGREAYIIGEGYTEIVTTRGGEFSHVGLVQGETIEAEWDMHGDVTRWIQRIRTQTGEEIAVALPPDHIQQFKFVGHPRAPYGISLISQNDKEINRYASNQDAIANATRMHAFPKYHVKVGREGQSIGDQILRLVRQRFRGFDEKTNWVTGADINIEQLDTGGVDISGISEHDLAILAMGFGIPKEFSNFGSDGMGTGAPAKSRLTIFELDRKSEQRRMAEQFIEQIAVPLVETFSPFSTEGVDIDIKFGDVISDQNEAATWVSMVKEYMTVDEVREAMDLPPHEGDDDELGPPGGGMDPFGGGPGGFGGGPPGMPGEPADEEPEEDQGNGAVQAVPREMETNIPPNAVAISDASKAPDGAHVIQGPAGGLYYIPGIGEQESEDVGAFTNTGDDNADEEGQTALDKGLVAVQEPGDGFTVSLDSSEAWDGDAIVVGLGGDVFPADEPPTAEQVEELAAPWREAFAELDEDMTLGGWHDPDSGQIYIDVGVAVVEEEFAMELATTFGQKAVWDNANQEVIDVDRDVSGEGVQDPTEAARIISEERADDDGEGDVPPADDETQEDESDRDMSLGQWRDEHGRFMSQDPITYYLEHETDDSVSEDEAYLMGLFPHAIWTDDPERHLFKQSSHAVPQGAKMFLQDAIDSGVLFNRVDSLGPWQVSRLTNVIRDATEDGQWTVGDVAGMLMETGIPESEAKAMTWAQSELAAVVNKARELELESRQLTEVVEVRWVGPNDNATTDACKEAKALTRDGVTLARLKEIIREMAEKHFGGLEPREWMIHPNERHTHVRV